MEPKGEPLVRKGNLVERNKDPLRILHREIIKCIGDGTAHIEPTKGSKDQVGDYINKRGRWEEKGEEILVQYQIGEFNGRQRGKRTDLERFQDMINEGLTPKEIKTLDSNAYKYNTYIKDMYFDKRSRETPFVRDVKVHWIVGESGSGKTYIANELVEKFGVDHVYIISDYEKGGFDNYNGQEYLVLDEYRGQLPFTVLLCIIDKYKKEIHARYVNILPLWHTVYVTSILPPEICYKKMVSEYAEIDTIGQLLRRIDDITYKYKIDIPDEETFYNSITLDTKQYINYSSLKLLAEQQKRFDMEQLGLINPNDKP